MRLHWTIAQTARHIHLDGSPNLSLVDMRPEKIRHSMKDHRVTWRGNQTIFAQGAVGEQGLKACQTDLEEN